MPQTTPYFVYTPNPFVCDGQTITPCDLKHGESLEAFLLRHVPHLTTNGWVVSIGGVEVAPDMWSKTFPKPGMHIACHAVVAKQVVQLVAIVALTYFTFGFGAATAGMWGAGAAASSLGALGAIGVYMVGSILINKVLAPKPISFNDSGAAKQVYSLSSQRNSARAYEPIGTLWGEMRVTPDLASQPYAWYESDDQYMSTILLGGVNVHSVSDLSIGDSPISSFQDVDVYYNGFSGMTDQSIPLSSNTDSVAGGEIPTDQTWVTRTSSAGAVRLSVDMEYSLFYQGSKGLRMAGSEITIQYRAAGTSAAWEAFRPPVVLRNKSTEIKRKSWSLKVPEGQYEVRIKQKILPRPNSSESDSTRNFAWTSLRSNQADKTDYSQFGRIGVRIRATGQVSGSLDTVRATYRAKPMPVWTGTAWATATTRKNGLSNPGAILLQTLRGVKHKGRLQFGFGLADEDIDIEGLKAFMLYCAGNNYTYDRWITSEISLLEFCEEVARAGMGEFSWTDGSRPTAVFVAPGQPNSAVINMANMAKASFSVDYAVATTADGIEYQYVDRARNFETSTIRVSAPGVTTPLNPARITGEGVTTEAHAARMARFHLGQSLYQYKTISFGASIEHLDYRRLNVLSVSHDLTQWGFGGRVQGVVVGKGFIQVRLSEPVPPLSTPKLGLRLPGKRDYRVWDVTPFVGNQEVLTLVGSWPVGERVPGDGDDNPAYDTLWCYDFKATPGYRVRVVNMEPEANLKGATITCVPEGPEFWDYVLNGSYVPAPNQSALPELARPLVKNIRITEQANVEGNVQSWQLNAVWESKGEAQYCQVWAGLDGAQLNLVDARAVGNRSSWRIDEPGKYLVQVRPFDAAGRAGDSVSVVYVTTGVDIPPVNVGTFTVQEVAGGLRRFAWAFSGDVPATFAGVKIRHIDGEHTVTTQTWEDLTPLGDVDDTYTAQFETTKPPAGLYTFAIRTINTSGRLSTGVRYTSLTLSESFEQVQQPDVTPPPEPTGFEGFVGLSVATLYTNLPTYTAGHGHKTTKFYYAQAVQGQPLPTFSSAKLAAETPGTHATATVEVGKTYLFWATWTSNDGIESAHTTTPVTIAAGKVGDADLSDDLDLAAKLADGSISGTKLAAQSLDATKFAQSIQPVTIWTGPALPTTKRTNNLTWNSKLYTWNGTAYVLPPAGELVDGSVTAQKIAAGAVDAAKIAADVELVKIWTGGTLPTTRQGSVLSWNGKLYRWDGTKYTAEVATADLTGQIDSTKLADNAVTVSKIAAGAVEAGKLATNAVTSDKIAAGAVGVAKFASGIEPVTVVSGSTLPTVKTTETITFQGKLYRWSGTAYTSAVPTADLTGTISSGQLAAGAVDATKFASSIEPVTLATGASLPTVKSTTVINWNNKLYRWDGTKYTAEVVVDDIVGQIAATQISDNAITAPKLAANAVVAGKIAANAVTAGTVAADAITAGKIAAGAVNTRELAANSVTANKLVVTSTDTVNVDPFFQDADMWANANFTRKVVEGAPGPNVLATSIATSMQVPAAYMTPIDTSKTYLFETWFIATAAQTNRAFASIRFYDANGALLTGADAPNPGAGWPGTNASSGNFYFPAVSAVTPTTWTRTALTVGPNGVAQFPAKAAYFTAGAFLNYGSAAPIVESQWGGFRVTEMARGELIVDGAVTADKVAANAITANSIAAGAVTAGKIAANAVTANEIAANSVTTAKIAAGAVTAAEVAAGAITASKLLIGDTTNLVADPAWNDTAAWSSGSSNYTFEAAEAADNAARCARYSAANKTGTANGYASEIYGAFVPVEQGRTLALSIRIRDYLTAAGVLQLGIVTKKANGTTYFTNRDTYTLGTVNGYTVRTATYAVAADDVSVAIRVRHQFTAAGTFNGPHKLLEPVIRVMQSGELIVDGAITAAKIAAKTITAAEIAAGAITATELGANSVTAGKIAAGTVTADELATNSVTAVKVAAGAITADKIAANAVTANEIAANSVTTAKIAAGAVTATEIATGAVTTSKLVVSDPSTMVPDAEYQDITMWSGGFGGTVQFKLNEPNPLAGTVSKTVLQVNRVASGTTAYDGASSSRFAVTPNTDYVLRVNVYCPAASTVKIEVVTLTTADVSRSTDLDVTYPTSGWGTHELKVRTSATESRARVYVYIREDSAASFLLVGKMRFQEAAAGVLIVDGAITADKIAANAVTANAIAANAVTAGKIAANAVTAGTIAAGAVSADQIAANAITASKLVVADRSNMLSDTEFKDLVYWYTNMVTSTDAAAVAALNCSPVMANVAGSTSNTELYNRTKEYFMSVEPGRIYRVSIDVYIAAGWNGIGWLNIQGYASNGSTATTSGNAYTNDYRTTPAAAATTLAMEFDYAATSTTAFVRFRFLATYTNAAVAGLFIGNPRVRLKTDSTLIVDGAITATKLAANSIAVGTAAIQAGAIVNAHIGNLSADKITAGTLAAARIAAGSIDAGKLAANAVTADKVNAGAITVDKLASNSVTAVKIAASTITADKISVTTLSAIAANLGTVTAGRVQNPANTSYWDLNAAGATTMFRLGSDLEYSVAGGLKINKLNVVGTAQIASSSITDVLTRERGNYSFNVSSSRMLDDFTMDGSYANYLYLSAILMIKARPYFFRVFDGTEGGSSQLVEWGQTYGCLRVSCYIGATLSPFQIYIEIPNGYNFPYISPMYPLPSGTTRVVITMLPGSRSAPEGSRQMNNIQISLLSIKR